MRVLVDTSALFALLCADDSNAVRARAAFERAAVADVGLVCTSYVLVETYALVGRRLGAAAVAAFRADVAPLLQVVWVDATLLEAGLDRLVADGRRSLSLVDCVSFVAFERLGLDAVMAFDRHFDEAGLPAFG